VLFIMVRNISSQGIIEKFVWIIKKNLFENPLIYIILASIPTLLLLGGYLIDIFYFGSFRSRDCLFLIVRFGIFMPIFWGEYLVSRDILSKSYALTRSLPISDQLSYFSKLFFSSSALLLSEIPGIILLSSYFERSEIFLYLPTIFAILLISTSLTFYLILKTGSRVAFLAINIGVELFIYLWRTFEESYPEKASQIISSHPLFMIASALLILGTYFFYWLGVQHLVARDTKELVS